MADGGRAAANSELREGWAAGVPSAGLGDVTDGGVELFRSFASRALAKTLVLLMLTVALPKLDF
jgi:hypothetical protein